MTYPSDGTEHFGVYTYICMRLRGQLLDMVGEGGGGEGEQCEHTVVNHWTQ